MNWSSSILWGIIGIVCTIFFGFIFSYIFYRKGLKQKRLICYRNSTTLISENISKYKELKILYNDKEIQTLTSTLINFKNVGNDIIEPTDIIPSDPITINTSGNFLSSADETLFEIKVSNPKVKASLEYLDATNLKLIFDFLPPKCEISVTLLHNGDISISGDLKVGLFKQNVKNYSSESNRYMYYLMEKTMDKFISLYAKIIYYLSFVLLAYIPLEIINSDSNTYTIKDILLVIFIPITGFFALTYQKLNENKSLKTKSDKNTDDDD